ncbi:hypothetical protein VPH35_126291 [Triticum aestivum]
MYGFSPPSRDVAPPPWVRRKDLLLHVDLVEDWTLLSPRSSSSPQSGIPSSESKGDTRPFPAVYPGTWVMKIEDGQAPDDQGCAHRPGPGVANTGCHGMPFGGHRRSHDGDDGGGRRSWKDTLLGRGRSSREVSAAAQPQQSQQRQRSRTPTSRHNQHRHNVSKNKHAPFAHTQAEAAGHASPDPVAAFSEDATVLAPPPPPAPAAVNDVDIAAAEATAEPLCFPDSQSDHNPMPAAALSSRACRAPAPSTSVGVQVGAVTQRVQQLDIQEQDGTATPRHLFTDVLAPILPPPRPSAPKKTRTASAPVRQSARQASNRTEVPVAHRATLRIIRDLGLLGPNDKMTPKAADALIKKFDEPLTEDDIIGPAKLTRQDPAALRVTAGLAGPDGAPLGEVA